VIRFLPVLLGVAVLAGCGGGDVDPASVLSQTAEDLGKIRSAESMHLKLLVDPGEGDPFGFELQGPVALCGEQPLPTIDVEYTQIANGQEATVRLVSTGKEAFVVVNGTAYELRDDQEADLRSACDELGGIGGLESLRVGDWVREPDASAGDDVDTVTGELDVVAVTNDLVDIARAFGGSSLARLDRDDAQRIADATEDSSFELETGHDDHLLRRLSLEAELGFDVPEDLRRALGDAVGGTFTFELELEEPNAPVKVRAPANARPSSELPRG
jgi:hypothetical protein